MRKYVQQVLFAISFMLIAGCQGGPTGEQLFRLQPSDTSITTAIQDAIHQDVNLSALTLHVETKKGDVLLSGYVKTIRQSDTADELARKTNGVKSVQNNIIVRK